jgi:hypothetical protein
MRKALAVGLLLAGCGGGGGPDAGGRAVVRVAAAVEAGAPAEWAGSDETALSALDALDALGPDFARGTLGAADLDVTITLGVDFDLTFPACGVVFDRAGRTLRVARRCAASRPELQLVVRHSLEHWVGMAHAPRPALIEDTNSNYRTVTGRTDRDATEQWTISPNTRFDTFTPGYWTTELTANDLAEYARTHP